MTIDENQRLMLGPKRHWIFVESAVEKALGEGRERKASVSHCRGLAYENLMEIRSSLNYLANIMNENLLCLMSNNYRKSGDRENSH